jgi:alpha-tubulin suppressor-like RCC1 family protein
MLTLVCQHLDIVDLVRVAATCKLFRHGGLETVELPTESPVVTVLCKHAFSRPELIPSMRPIGCSESWVAYLARCARQRRCREAPPIAAAWGHSLFVDPAGRLLACGEGAEVGHDDVEFCYLLPTPVAAMAGVQVQSVAAGQGVSLALSGDGRVYSWGSNNYGQLGHGDKLARLSPALIEGLEGVRGIAVEAWESLAVTQSGHVYQWGQPLLHEGAENELRPVLVEGFGGVRMCCVCVGAEAAFAIGEAGELFSWGNGERGALGHGNRQKYHSPKRVEALRDIRVSSVSAGTFHAVALAEEGLVYVWGVNKHQIVVHNCNLERDLLPKPVEALLLTEDPWRNYALTDTGELWVRGSDPPLGHDEHTDCPVPKPIESLRGVKVDAVVIGGLHTLALADDGSMYAWGGYHSAISGALGLGNSMPDRNTPVCTPQRIPAVHTDCEF